MYAGEGGRQRAGEKRLGEEEETVRKRGGKGGNGKGGKEREGREQVGKELESWKGWRLGKEKGMVGMAIDEEEKGERENKGW